MRWTRKIQKRVIQNKKKKTSLLKSGTEDQLCWGRTLEIWRKNVQRLLAGVDINDWQSGSSALTMCLGYEQAITVEIFK